MLRWYFLHSLTKVASKSDVPMLKCNLGQHTALILTFFFSKGGKENTDSNAVSLIISYVVKPVCTGALSTGPKEKCLLIVIL